MEGMELRALGYARPHAAFTYGREQSSGSR
jgi:hypothetical protein